MRITFVLPLADLSGGTRTIAVYARWLLARGHEVCAVSSSPWAPPLRSRVGSLLRGRGWPSARPPGPGHLDGLDLDHRRVTPFRAIVDGDVPDADVVVATWWMTAEWVAALSPRKGVKVHFIQGHDLENPGAPRGRVAATWRLPFHRIVCSTWLAGIARDEFGYADVAVVPNGVDLEQFRAPPRGRQARPAVGLVYSSSAAVKGCDVATAAFERAARQLPGLRLVAFGHEPVDPALPLPDGAEFVLRPEQRRIPELYASCDAWLWPSRQEGFGLPILEAMACRTPVIAAPAGAAPEILADGGGVLLPATHPVAMADAIVRICTSTDEAWRALSDRAHENAQRRGWDASARLFEAALAAAVDPGGARRARP
jgi:glycosyltransferase involved in cell wall biosynthesis